jgi:hypothetical protein
MFQTFSKYLKEASILIIILALTKQLIYYNRFDIPISYFFGFSEIWLMLSDDMYYLGFFVLVFLWGYESIKKNELSQSQRKAEKKGKVEKIIDIIMSVLWLTFILAAIYRIFSKTDYSTKLNMIVTLIILITVFYIFHRNDKNNTKASDSAAILSLVLIFSFLIIKANVRIKSVENGKYKGTYIVTSDTTYRSTDTSYFIGKTEKFVFVYNKFDKTTSIIPVESIKLMVIKSN